MINGNNGRGNLVNRVEGIQIENRQLKSIDEIFDGKRTKQINEFEDIIKEQTAELCNMNRKLRENEERFKLALANSPIVVFNQDKELRYTWVHNARHGFCEEDFLGRNDNELNEDNSHVIELKQRVLHTGKGEHQESIFIINGEEYYYDLYVYPIFNPDGVANGITCVATDITERKLAEAALRQSEERFSAAFHLSPVIMAIMDRNRYLDVNEAWLQTFGYSREEVLSRIPSELNLWVNRKEFEENITALVKNKHLYNYELSYWNKDGEIRTGLASSEAINIDGAECYLHIMIDITQQKQIENEIARLDRLNLIGEMAAGIAHEIRNPMATVRGFIQLLKEQECYLQDQAYFELMIDELDRANDIISEILRMAKNKTIDLQPLQIDQVVKEALPMLEANANFKGMRIELDLTETGLNLIDDSEIRQLILNIALNGLEAMKPGGVLTIGTRLQKDETVLYIKDMGQGLDPKLINSLGIPFLTTKEKATGLGLAVCYSIAARHNAKISFDTGPEGTIFYVRFPIF